MASDDEFDRDAYHYRTRNASDLEEFGVEDDVYSVESDRDDVVERFRVTIGRDPVSRRV